MFILQLMIHKQLKSLLWLFEAKCACTLVGGLVLVLFEWMELTDMQFDGHFNWSLSAVHVLFCILYFVFVSNSVDLQSIIALVGSSKYFLENSKNDRIC